MIKCRDCITLSYHHLNYLGHDTSVFDSRKIKTVDLHCIFFSGTEQPLSKSAMKKKQKEAEKAAKKAQRQAAQAEQQKQQEADDVSKDLYGDMKMIQSSEKPGETVGKCLL